MASNEGPSALKQNSITSLRKEISSNLNGYDNLFFSLSENIISMRSRAQKRGVGSELSGSIESIIDDVISDSKNATLGDLKEKYKRIKSLNATLDSLKPDISKDEYNSLAYQTKATERILSQAIKKKSSITERTRGFVKFAGVDTSAILVGAATDNPISMFIAKMVGDGIQRMSEKKSNDKSKLVEDKNRVLQSMKAETKISPAMSSDIGSGATGNISAPTGDPISQISANTLASLEILKAIKQDTQHLVKIDQEQLKVEKSVALDNTESSLEAGRLGGPKPAAKKGGGLLDKPDGGGSDAFNYLLGALGLSGLASNLASLAKVVPTLSKVARIAVPTAIIAAGTVAWVKVFKQMPELWEGIKSDFGEFGRSLKKLPGGLWHELKKITGNLTPAEMKEEKKKDFIKNVSNLQQQKENLKALKASSYDFFGPDQESPAYKLQVAAQEEKIRQMEMEVLQMIKDQNKNAAPEKIVDMFNKTARQGQSPLSAAQLGIASTPVQDNITWIKKAQTLRSKLQAQNVPEEQIQKAILKIKRPGEAGFGAKKSTNMFEMPLEDVLNTQVRPKEQNMFDMPLEQVLAMQVTKSNPMLGKVSQKYESGKAGAGTISSGSGDAGGASYGTYQLASNTGTLGKFLESSGYASEFSGLAPGSSAFNSKWKMLADKDPNFGNAQHEFIKSTHYNPQLEKLKAQGLDLSGRGAAVQEAIFSTAVQYGPKSSVIQNALSGSDLSSLDDTDIVSRIQDYKAQNVDNNFRSSSQRVRKSVASRIQNEKADLLALAEKPMVDQAPASMQLASLSAKNSELSSSAMGGRSTVINNISQGGSSTQSQAPGRMSGSHGAVSTRQSDPMLYDLYAKQMKGSVV